MDVYGKNGNNNGNNIYEMPYKAHSIRTTKEFRDKMIRGGFIQILREAHSTDSVVHCRGQVW